jgi:hypothetical protein
MGGGSGWRPVVGRAFSPFDVCGREPGALPQAGFRRAVGAGGQTWGKWKAASLFCFLTTGLTLVLTPQERILASTFLGFSKAALVDATVGTSKAAEAAAVQDACANARGAGLCAEHNWKPDAKGFRRLTLRSATGWFAARTSPPCVGGAASASSTGSRPTTVGCSDWWPRRSLRSSGTSRVSLFWHDGGI